MWCSSTLPLQKVPKALKLTNDKLEFMCTMDKIEAR